MLGGQWEGRSEGSGNRNGLGWMGGLGEGERERFETKANPSALS